MSGMLHGMLSAPPAVVYLLVGLLVFAEAAVFIGFVLPGETAVVLGGVLASRHAVDLRALLVLVAVAAVVGDTVGYEVGRHFGERVIATRPLRRHEHRLHRARTFLRERGAFAVFLGRWTAFLRAVMPGLAGVSRMPYRKFLFFNALGGIAWGTTFCLVGYLAGNSYEVVAQRIGVGGVAFTVGVVIALILGWQVRQRLAARREASLSPAPSSEPSSEPASNPSSAASPSPAASSGGQACGVPQDQKVAGDARRHP